MSVILERVGFVFEDPYLKAREEKERGRKVIGVTPMHFPEELVHASGALPVIMQESNEPVTLGFGYIYPFYCGFTRSTVDIAVKGKLDFFDAFVVSDMCLQIRQMAHILRRYLRRPFIYIQWPLEADEKRWLNFTVDKLSRCRAKLEEVTGRKISDKALLQSIELYNRNRALFRKLYELRKAGPGGLRAKEMTALVMSSMVMPKEEHNKILEEVISELEKHPGTDEGKVRVFLSGHLCQAAKADILDLVEDLGGVVVGDDLYTGFRYYATDITLDGSVMEALARRYLNLAVPCPTRADTKQDWGDYLIQATKECGAKGIVVLVVKFCEAHMIYYPYVKDRLDAAGIPHLLIETEHEVVSLEGVRTRLQAFMEMLRR